MKKYCKAYLLSDLRKFPGWTDEADASEGELADDSIVYITDEFDVMVSPVGEPKMLFSEVTPEWQEFCTSTLGFEIPELAFAYAESE